jgi:hypothetical protein
VPLPAQFLAIIDLAKQHLDNKEEIPDPLMAQLIKARLITLKAVEKEKEIARLVNIPINSRFLLLFYIKAPYLQKTRIA